jgi:meiotically up-regulated gene 157 (Mug157) protein
VSAASTLLASRCFRGVKNLPVTYRNNKNAWMTGDIFSEWLQDFNKDMRVEIRLWRNSLLLSVVLHFSMPLLTCGWPPGQ